MAAAASTYPFLVILVPHRPVEILVPRPPTPPRREARIVRPAIY
jgi:hypothetical protein